MAANRSAAAVRPPEPRISRPLIPHLRGDRGTVNLHRVCGWISQELADRSGGGPPVAYWNGRGFSDSVRAVTRGEVDIAMTTPVAFTAAALEGRGAFAGEPFPELRALGVVRQHDRLTVGLRKTLGITSFAQLREDKPALRLATSVHDGANYVGLAAHEVLKRSGADIAGWGGRLMEDGRPSESLGHVLAGRADAIIHDAYMLPHWQQFGGEFSFVEIEPAVLDGLWADYSWPSAYAEAGHFPGSPRLRTWISPTSWFLPAVIRRTMSPTRSPGCSARPAMSSSPSTGTCPRAQPGHLPPGSGGNGARSRSAAPGAAPLLRRADHELTARRPRCERPE